MPASMNENKRRICDGHDGEGKGSDDKKCVQELICGSSRFAYVVLQDTDSIP